MWMFTHRSSMYKHMCMYTHVGPLKPMFDMKQNQETLTWSRRRALWLRQGKWWLQTPGRTGWVEMDGEEQKQRHLLLPQPPHCWSQASEIEGGGRQREVAIYCLPAVKGCFPGQNGMCGVRLGGGAIATDWKRKPTLCKAANKGKH